MKFVLLKRISGSKKVMLKICNSSFSQKEDDCPEAIICWSLFSALKRLEIVADMRI